MDITVCTYKPVGIVEKIMKLYSSKYTVICRADMSVILEMEYFPETKKLMMYRTGLQVIFLPMRVRNNMGNAKLLDNLQIKASF